MEAGRGRGRGLTMPAWMQKQQAGGAPPGVPPPQPGPPGSQPQALPAQQPPGQAPPSPQKPLAPPQPPGGQPPPFMGAPMGGPPMGRGMPPPQPGAPPGMGRGMPGQPPMGMPGQPPMQRPMMQGPHGMPPHGYGQPPMPGGAPPPFGQGPPGMPPPQFGQPPMQGQPPAQYGQPPPQFGQPAPQYGQPPPMMSQPPPGYPPLHHPHQPPPHQPPPHQPMHQLAPPQQPPMQQQPQMQQPLQPQQTLAQPPLAAPAMPPPATAPPPQQQQQQPAPSSSGGGGGGGGGGGEGGGEGGGGGGGGGLKSAWTEHTDKNSGKTYYYNGVTKQSSWTKPQELMTASERVVSSSLWKEYTSADGRKYYHNTSTNQTTWTRPPELDQAEEQEAGEGGGQERAQESTEEKAMPAAVNGETKTDGRSSPAEGDGGGGGGAGGAGAKRREDDEDGKVEAEEPEKKKPKVHEGPAPTYETKEDAQAAFKSLLEEDAMGDLQQDVRWKALKSTGEKKNAFQGFLAKKQRDFVDSERIRKKAAKEAFQELLRESPLVDHRSRYRDVMPQLATDPRFSKVDSERERADLFEDHVGALEKQEKERLRASRTENLANFRALLSETEGLTAKTRWSEVKTMLKDEARFTALDGDDKYRLEAFDDFMVELGRKEAEEKELAREKKKAEEKAQRVAFVELLEEQRVKGKVTAKTQWREIKDDDEVSNDPRWTAMLEQSKTKATESLQEFVEDLSKKYQADRSKLKEAYKAAADLDILTCDLAAFTAAVRQHQPAADCSQEHVTLFYNELLKLGEEEKDRRKRHAEKEFKRLIRKYRERKKLDKGASLEAAAAACGERSAWKEVPDDTRPALYTKVCTELDSSTKERSRSRSRSHSRERSRDRDRDHKKRHRSRSRSRDKDEKKRSKKDKDSKRSKDKDKDDKERNGDKERKDDKDKDKKEKKSKDDKDKNEDHEEGEAPP